MVADPSRSPATAVRAETLSDGSLVVWDPLERERSWIHGAPVAVER